MTEFKCGQNERQVSTDLTKAAAVYARPAAVTTLKARRAISTCHNLCHKGEHVRTAPKVLISSEKHYTINLPYIGNYEIKRMLLF